MPFQEDQDTGRLEKVRADEAEALTQILADKYGLPYANLGIVPIDIDALKLVPEAEARATGVAVIARTGKKITVAIKNPEISATKSLLEKFNRKGLTSTVFLSSLPSLEQAWEHYKEIPVEHDIAAGIVEISVKKIEELKGKISALADLGTLITELLSGEAKARATNLLELILAGALQLDASDIHLETEEKGVSLRLRLDGVLHNIIDVPTPVYTLILSRIKLLSEMKLNVRNRAQDGRFTIRAGSVDIEIRVSVLPSGYGETIVMRILNPKAIGLKLGDLGIQKPVYDQIIKEIRRPNGMILTTGPTGSGKTTTLYAFLKEINTESIKIITIENPIEYHLNGISQTQIDVKGDYTFKSGLEAILRQDPDVILVGEIRNFETAETAIHAALTGHLVFSTLHTNDAPGTVPRLIDMGVKPNILAPAINVAIAQRLLRRLCGECKKETPLTPEENKMVLAELKTVPNTYEKPDTKNLKSWTPVGCEECNGLGYKGRVGIYELFQVDGPMERMILDTPSADEIREEAIKKGMLPMRTDGILKILAGMTSFSELERIAGSE